MGLLGACCLMPLAGRIIIIILGHKWTNSIAKRERKYATQPGPEGNPKPKSPKVTEVTFGDVGLGFPSMEPFCHSVV